MSKLQIYIIIGLIAAILIVFVIKAVQKSAETKAASAAAQKPNNISIGCNQLQTESKNALNAQEQASLGDWLNTVGSLGDSVASIFSGFNLGLGGGNKSSDVAASLAKG